MTTYCPTCHGIGEVPIGGQTMTSAVNMSWGTCPDCHGTGTVTECSRCMGLGVDLEHEDCLKNIFHPCPDCSKAKAA